MKKCLKFSLAFIVSYLSLFFMNGTIKANKVASDGSFTVNGKTANINDEIYKMYGLTEKEINEVEKVYT